MCVPRRRRRAAEGHREAARTLFGGRGDRVIDQVALSSSALNLNRVFETKLTESRSKSETASPRKLNVYSRRVMSFVENKVCCGLR